MKLYFAGAESNKYNSLLEKLEVENVLMSFFYLKRKIINNKFKDIFLDSGAFSAFTKKKEINIDNYIDFIKNTKDTWTVYAGLDVIGDYKKTRKNQEYMESKGLNPLPTFHYGSPYSELERMCKKYDYIALGGLVPISLNRKEMKRHLDYCFAIIKKYFPKKIHAFGVNAFWAWERYPFYSVDATSWLTTIRYGYKNDKYKIVNMYKNEKYNPDSKIKIEIKKLRKKADEITNLWAKRGIIWK